MLDVTTIILTYNEELHIRRCLENVCSFSKKVYVIDSPSTDNTVEICKEFPQVEVVVHPYPGNQAQQFNWAIDHLLIETDWVLRVDADEYLLPELVDELMEKLPVLSEDIAGLEFKRRHIFMGKWVKSGVYPVAIMRMFRYGKARYDNRLMDEHLVLSEGQSVVFDHDFCDHSLINISDYCRKHIQYAHREAAQLVSETYHFYSGIQHSDAMKYGCLTMETRKKKSRYLKLPMFWRCFAYFLYRYVLKGGFRDGKEGFLFAFIQGWWYRTLVDAKLLECKRYINSKNICTNTPEGQSEIKKYIAEHWNIFL